MKIVCFIALFVLFGVSVFSQHIGYRDETKKYEPQKKDVVKEKPPYIDYPDKCPGRSTELPFLNNFVLPDVVRTLKQKYLGYLYSVTSIKVAENQFKYKVSVCKKGVMMEEIVDQEGTVVP